MIILRATTSSATPQTLSSRLSKSLMTNLAPKNIPLTNPAHTNGKAKIDKAGFESVQTAISSNGRTIKVGSFAALTAGTNQRRRPNAGAKTTLNPIPTKPAEQSSDQSDPRTQNVDYHKSLLADEALNEM
jgi:hypothetical protein